MSEAYAAMLVGVVSAAAAILALMISRTLQPIPYTAVHVLAILLMALLLTFAYEQVPVSTRHPNLLASKAIYIAVSWLTFAATLLVYSRLNRPCRTTTALHRK